MNPRADIFRSPRPGDRLSFLDGSAAFVVRDDGDRVHVLVLGAPEIHAWPRGEFELQVLAAVDLWRPEDGEPLAAITALLECVVAWRARARSAGEPAGQVLIECASELERMLPAVPLEDP